MRSTVLLSLAVCLLGVDSGAVSLCRPPNLESVSVSMTSSASSASSSTESIASSATASSADGLTTSTTSASVATSTASTETTTASASSTDESSTSTETTSTLSTTSATADASTTASISTTSAISSTIPSVSTTTSAATSSTSEGPEPIATFNIVASGANIDGELLSTYRETSGYAIFKPNPQLPYHRTVQFSIEPGTGGYVRTDKGQYVCIEYYSNNAPGPIAYCDAQGGTLAYLECEKPVQGQLVCSVPAPTCVVEFNGEDFAQVCTRGASGERWNRFYTTLSGTGYYVYIGVGDGIGYTPME
ncbi:hypothetical protein LRP88_12924 [Fusarium phalaenopsidis]